MARRGTEAPVQATARAKFIRMSPYKVRHVAGLIKGKPIDEARRILAFTPHAASREIAKVLEAAIANAEHNFQIPQEELIVKSAYADEGLTIPRARPRAQGRQYRIRKRTSHISMVLERSPELAAATSVSTPRRRRTEATEQPTAPEEKRTRRTRKKEEE